MESNGYKTLLVLEDAFNSIKDYRETPYASKHYNIFFFQFHQGLSLKSLHNPDTFDKAFNSIKDYRDHYKAYTLSQSTIFQFHQGLSIYRKQENM